MVDAVTNAAVSGLRAADTRVATAANNIVNANTPEFRPSEVKQTEAPGGGVQTVVEKVPLTAAEQADLELQQFVNTSIAVYDAKASAIVIRVQRDLNKQLFDIQA